MRCSFEGSYHPRDDSAPTPVIRTFTALITQPRPHSRNSWHLQRIFHKQWESYKVSCPTMMCSNHQEKCSMMDSRSASRTPPPRAWGGAGRRRRGECHMWLRGTGPGAVTMTTIAGEDTMSSNFNTMHCYWAACNIDLQWRVLGTQVCSLSPAVSSYANKGFSPDRVHNQTRSKPCQGLSQVESIWLNTFPLRSLLINFQMKTLKTPEPLKAFGKREF